MSEPIPAFPLSWPAGWPRAKSREHAKFSKKTRGQTYAAANDLSVADGVRRVLGELGRMNIRADDIVISTNVKPRLDGWPSSSEGNPGDPGAAVYWLTRKRETRVMAIDRYYRLADNLAAIAATLDALRAIERHGGGQILDRAFTGFTALPAPGQTVARGWREVLGVDPQENSVDKVREKYRRLSAVHHPDRGGSSDVMAELNWAWTQAQTALAVHTL